MIRRNQKILNNVNVLTDVALIFVSYFIAIYIRFDIMNGYVSISLRDTKYVMAMFFYSIIVVMAYYCAGVYKSGRFKKVSSQSLLIIFINGVGAMLLFTILYYMRIQDFSRIALSLFALISTALVILKRATGKKILQYYRKAGFNQKHHVLIGDGGLAIQYAEDINAHPEYGVTIDGYVGEKNAEGLGNNLGNYSDIANILAAKAYDSVVVALEPDEIIYMRDIFAAADKEGIHIEMIPFCNDFIPAYPTIESIGKTKLINLRATPMDNLLAAACKRVMDIVGAIAILVLFSPLMLFTAIGVKLSSPGPIFFVQERIGKNKKPFKMLKFRSMRIDTDNEGWSTHKDDRRTKFGSFIRKYSIDELPQAINVLLGQMSLVGPRPELDKFAKMFSDEIRFFMVRQQAKPGMTGWAQINGYRGDTSIKLRVEHDIWYIENWSLGLDI